MTTFRVTTRRGGRYRRDAMRLVPSYGTNRRIRDGFLLSGTRVAGISTAQVMDLPSRLLFAAATTDPGNAQVGDENSGVDDEVDSVFGYGAAAVLSVASYSREVFDPEFPVPDPTQEPPPPPVPRSFTSRGQYAVVIGQPDVQLEWGAGLFLASSQRLYGNPTGAVRRSPMYTTDRVSGAALFYTSDPVLDGSGDIIGFYAPMPVPFEPVIQFYVVDHRGGFEFFFSEQAFSDLTGGLRFFSRSAVIYPNTDPQPVSSPGSPGSAGKTPQILPTATSISLNDRTWFSWPVVEDFMPLQTAIDNSWLCTGRAWVAVLEVFTTFDEEGNYDPDTGLDVVPLPQTGVLLQGVDENGGITPTAVQIVAGALESDAVWLYGVFWAQGDDTYDPVDNPIPTTDKKDICAAFTLRFDRATRAATWYTPAYGYRDATDINNVTLEGVKAAPGGELPTLFDPATAYLPDGGVAVYRVGYEGYLDNFDPGTQGLGMMGLDRYAKPLGTSVVIVRGSTFEHEGLPGGYELFARDPDTSEAYESWEIVKVVDHYPENTGPKTAWATVHASYYDEGGTLQYGITIPACRQSDQQAVLLRWDSVYGWSEWPNSELPGVYSYQAVSLHCHQRRTIAVDDPADEIYLVAITVSAYMRGVVQARRATQDDNGLDTPGGEGLPPMTWVYKGGPRPEDPPPENQRGGLVPVTPVGAVWGAPTYIGTIGQLRSDISINKMFELESNDNFD